MDYQGNLQLWDVRASMPLGSVAAHNGKALCLDWMVGSASDGQESAVVAVSGGSDCVLRSSTCL